MRDLAGGEHCDCLSANRHLQDGARGVYSGAGGAFDLCLCGGLRCL